MWRRRICQHPIFKCAFRESERAREARRPFCSRSQSVAALRRSSRLLAAAAGQSVSSVGVRSVFLFPRRVRALGFQRLLAEQPSQHGPSGTAPCDQLVRGNAMSASHQATLVPVSGRFGGYFNISMPRPAVTVLLGAGGNRISRRLRFTEERPQSTPRVRALRRLQDQVTDSRLEHALAHSCIRHIV